MTAKVGRSVVQSTAANFASIAVSVALVVIVSRLLPPETVGSFVMAFAVVFFIDQLREFQLPSYIMKLDRLDAVAMGSIRAVAMLTSALAVIGVVAAASFFRIISGEELVANCLAIMALGFVLRPWSQPALAILGRDLRYGVIASVKFAAAAVRLSVTLYLIVSCEMGAEALAWGVVAEYTVEAVGIAFIAPDQRFSSPSRDGINEVFAFCSRFTVATTLIQMSVAAAPLLIGGYHGFAMAALYNRATAVTRLLRSGVERAVLLIAVREFSRDRGDLARLKQRYLAGLGMLTSVSWPALACFAFLSEPIVLLLFGTEWAGTAPLASVLAVAGIVFAAGALSQQVHAALDRPDTILKREAVIQTVQIAMLVSVAPLGAMAVVLGMLAMSVVTLGFQLVLLRQEIALGVGEYWRAIGRSVVLCLVPLMAVIVLERVLGAKNLSAGELSLIVGAGVLSWIVTAFAIRSPLPGEFLKLFRRDPTG